MKLNELINESITKVQLQDYLRRQKLMAIGNKDKIISDIIEHYHDDSNAILSGFRRDELIDILNHFSLANTGNKQEMIDRIRKRLLGEKVEKVSPEYKTWEVVWSLLDERIVNIAISRVEAGHFADAVFNSMLLVKSRVKTEYLRKKPGKDIDGVDLMHQAFGSNSNPPVIPLDDLSTITGRDRQEGYHNIFAGAMQAIRNPKAHGFENITEGRTIHHLFVASLLMSVLDEAEIK